MRDDTLRDDRFDCSTSHVAPLSDAGAGAPAPVEAELPVQGSAAELQNQKKPNTHLKAGLESQIIDFHNSGLTSSRSRDTEQEKMIQNIQRIYYRYLCFK